MLNRVERQLDQYIEDLFHSSKATVRNWMWVIAIVLAFFVVFMAQGQLHGNIPDEVKFGQDLTNDFTFVMIALGFGIAFEMGNLCLLLAKSIIRRLWKLFMFLVWRGPKKLWRRIFTPQKPQSTPIVDMDALASQLLSSPEFLKRAAEMAAQQGIHVEDDDDLDLWKQK